MSSLELQELDSRDESEKQDHVINKLDLLKSYDLPINIKANKAQQLRKMVNDRYLKKDRTRRGMLDKDM